MKHIAKWLAISVLLLVVLIGIRIAWRHRLEERTRETREAEYELPRHRYADVLRPGITRKKVEGYLRKNNVVIVHRSYDDLVKIGHEDPPWYCRERNVYVDFQFDHHGENSSQWRASDLDVLTAITTTYWLDACL